MPDQRIVYGARCVWWDGIGKIGHIVRGEHRLPACPRCHGVLFEMSEEAEWWAAVDAYEARGHPGYHTFVEWLRGKCFADPATAAAAYRAAGGEVQL